MKVYIDQAEHNLDKFNFTEFNDFWLEETKRLLSSKRYFQSIEINGIPYLNGYEEAIANNFSDIQEIKITTIMEEVLIKDSLKELYAYNKKLINACHSIGSLFYGELNEEDWNSFSMLLEGVQWVYNHIRGIHAILYRNSQNDDLTYFLKEVEESLENILKEIEQVMNEKEYTQLADAISYQLSEIFVELDTQLTQVIE